MSGPGADREGAAEERLSNERARLAALRRYDLLDTPPEEGFDRITSLVAEVFGVPIALVNLIDAERQFSKSCYGIDLRAIDRQLSFCTHTVRHDRVFVVPDAHRDERFADNPLVVGDPRIRFYAGAPLRTPDGHNVGALCLIDERPHAEFGARERAMLERFAATVVDEFELRLANRRVLRELRRRAKAEARLAEMVTELERRAFRDDLTGLANRALIADRLRQALAFARRHEGGPGGTLGVALIDLDGFKPVNDRYGHAAGDAVLVELGARLRGAVRSGDTAGRLGGDEFVAVCRDADAAAMERVAERCLAELKRPVEVEDEDGARATVELGASVGVALFPQHGRDGDELMRAADDAMYRAKEAGGGVRFSEAPDEPPGETPDEAPGGPDETAPAS